MAMTEYCFSNGEKGYYSPYMKNISGRRRLKISQNITPFKDIAVLGETEAADLCELEPNKWCAVSICAPSMYDGSKYKFKLKNTKKVSRYYFHDISEKMNGGVLATEEDVKAILAFSEQCHGESLLIHCAAGISRSTASAFLIVLNSIKDKCRNPAETALDIIYQIRPVMHPNRLILEIGVPLIARNEEELIAWFRELYNAGAWRRINL